MAERKLTFVVAEDEERGAILPRGKGERQAR